MNTSTISYLDAKSEDMIAITDLINSVHGDDRNLDHRQFIVAKDLEKIVGCIRTIQVESDCKEMASLVVLPEYRKQGIGSTLVDLILKKDLSRPLYLVCHREKIPLYTPHAFHEVGVQKIPETLQRDFIEMKQHKGDDIVVMQTGQEK